MCIYIYYYYYYYYYLLLLSQICHRNPHPAPTQDNNYVIISPQIMAHYMLLVLMRLSDLCSTSSLPPANIYLVKFVTSYMQVTSGNTSISLLIGLINIYLQLLKVQTL